MKPSALVFVLVVPMLGCDDETAADYYTRCVALEGRGDLTEAKGQCEEAAKRAPNSKSGKLAAKKLVELGPAVAALKTKQAQTEYSKCVAAEKSGDVLGAAPACEAAVAADPSSSSGKAAAAKLTTMQPAIAKAREEKAAAASAARAGACKATCLKTADACKEAANDDDEVMACVRTYIACQQKTCGLKLGIPGDDK